MTCSVSRRDGVSVCETQTCQTWIDADQPTLEIMVLVGANAASSVEGVYARVEHAIHLGVAMTIPGPATASRQVFQLDFVLRGLKKVRPYEIVVEQVENSSS